MPAKPSVPNWLLIVGFCAVAALTGLSFIRPGATPARAGHLRPQWMKLWADTFSGPAGQGVDTRYWRYQTGTGDFGNGEVQTMTTSPANIHLNGDGGLDITARWQGGIWTSGRIQTRAVFTPPPGGELMVTASLVQPRVADGLGYWPAFWMLGRGHWPAHGEIDIMEDVNALSAHSAALHCGNLDQPNPDGTFGPCHEHNGLSSGMRPCPGCQQGYHTYSVIIDRRQPGAERITWYLDGRQFFTIPESRVGGRAWAEAVDHGFSIIFDLAIGGSYPDARCDCRTPAVQTTSGGTIQLHRVAVYRR